MKSIAQLGRGMVSVEMVGVVGRDAAATEYKQAMNLAGVGTAALLESAKGTPSAQSVCLVTPDGQRTMRVFLGAASELDEARISASVPAALLSSAQLLHMEGYALRRPGAARAAVLATSSCGGVVSLDLASSEVVAECFGPLSDLLALGVVDLVFGNEAEVQAVGVQEALLGSKPVPSGPTAREAGISFLLRHVQVVNVTLGAEGSLTVRKDKERFVTPALPVTAVDSTGAGDTYTAGYLWALLHGAPLPICAAQGCAMAAEVVRTLGSNLDDATWRRLREGSYGFAPPGERRAPAAALPRAESQADASGFDEREGRSSAALKGTPSRGNVWGQGDEEYDPKHAGRHPNDDPLRPSDYALNDEGQLVKIKRTMSGRIYGAVFDQVEQCQPHPQGQLRRSMSSRVGDDFGMAYQEFQPTGELTRSPSSAAVAAAASGCAPPALPDGYNTYFGYLLAWGLGWLDEDPSLDVEAAGARMRRSMSSRVMSGRSIGA